MATIEYKFSDGHIEEIEVTEEWLETQETMSADENPLAALNDVTLHACKLVYSI